MKIEEVIKQLESILDHTRSMAAESDADEIWKEDITALEFAITALRSIPETGEPCEFCEKADFGEFGFEITKHYAKISGALGSYRFPKERQFSYCPKCGRPLTEEAWAELERRARG